MSSHNNVVIRLDRKTELETTGGVHLVHPEAVDAVLAPKQDHPIQINNPVPEIGWPARQLAVPRDHARSLLKECGYLQIALKVNSFAAQPDLQKPTPIQRGVV